MAQKNIYKRETGSQTQTCGCQMKGGEGDGLRVWGSQMQPITFRMDKQGPTVYSTENWTQSPRINIMEKEHREECACFQLRHFAVQQNPAQRCKSAILQ